MELFRTSSFIAITCLVFVSAAHAEPMGKALPKNVELTKLSEILKAPKKYKGKEVVIQGNYVARCCPTDFIYKEGLDSIEISPKGFDQWGSIKRGTPVRVSGTINVIERDGGDKIVHMDASGLETK